MKNQKRHDPQNKAGDKWGEKLPVANYTEGQEKNPQYLGMKKSLMMLSHFVRTVNIYISYIIVC